MRVRETIRTAFAALIVNKVRTFLTMLGIIIGVFSVVLLISLVRGVQNYITDQFNSIGSNIVYVMPGQGGIYADPATSFTQIKIEEKHEKYIKSQMKDHITEITSFISTSKIVTYKTRTIYATFNATNTAFEKLFNISMDKGRFFTEAENMGAARVAVLGSKAAKDLFTSRNALGESINIDGHPFRVIGVMASKGLDFDQQISIPLNTAKKYLDSEQISYITVGINDKVTVEQGAKEVEVALMQDLKKEDFSVMTQKDILSSVTNILNILQLGLGAVAAISLLVGGIGIMNIMLVAVSERIMEIGLRKALGATPANIATQFLIESIFLSLGGGLIGLALGFLASYAARTYLRTETPWWAVAVSLGFSVFVGVAFGTYPALKASKKDPIEALRFE